MKIIVECKRQHRLADFVDLKLTLLDLGYDLTITPDGDLRAYDPAPTPAPRMELDLITLSRPQKPIWPPRKLRSVP